MKEDLRSVFIRQMYQAISEAMQSADQEPVSPQYRLGVRKLAKDFFDNFDLLGLGKQFPELQNIDVDAWYAGQQLRQ